MVTEELKNQRKNYITSKKWTEVILARVEQIKKENPEIGHRVWHLLEANLKEMRCKKNKIRSGEREI